MSYRIVLPGALYVIMHHFRSITTVHQCRLTLNECCNAPRATNKQRNATTQDKYCHMSERTPSLNDLVGVALPCDFLSLWKPQRHQKNVMCTDFCGKENLNLMTTHTFYIIAFERISFLDNFQNLATLCLRTSDVRKQPTSS